MKKIIYIIILMVISCKSKHEIIQKNITSIKSKSEHYKSLSDFKGDTLKFLQTNFLTHKEYYLDKPLSLILNDLELNIKSYATFSGKNIHESKGLYLGFYTQGQEMVKIKNKKNPLVLIIEWKSPLPNEKIVVLSQKNKQKWTKDESELYGQQIVKEIGMVVP